MVVRPAPLIAGLQEPGKVDDGLCGGLMERIVEICHMTVVIQIQEHAQVCSLFGIHVDALAYDAVRALIIFHRIQDALFHMDMVLFLHIGNQRILEGGVRPFYNSTTTTSTMTILDSGKVDFLAAPGVYNNREPGGCVAQREMQAALFQALRSFSSVP